MRTVIRKMPNNLMTLRKRYCFLGQLNQSKM